MQGSAVLRVEQGRQGDHRREIGTAGAVAARGAARREPGPGPAVRPERRVQRSTTAVSAGVNDAHASAVAVSMRSVTGTPRTDASRARVPGDGLRSPER